MATIRKLPSGKFQAVVRLKGMKPLYAAFPTRNKAKLWARTVEDDTALARKLTRDELSLAQLVTLASSGGKHAIPVPTFSDLVESYMAQYAGRDRGTQGKLDCWVERFGDKRVTEITGFDVDDGLIELSKRPGRGMNKTLTGSNLWPATPLSPAITLARMPARNLVLHQGRAILVKFEARLCDHNREPDRESAWDSTVVATRTARSTVAAVPDSFCSSWLREAAKR